METRNKFNKEESYRIPLTVFDVVRIQKLGKIPGKEKKVQADKSQKVAEQGKDFFFPLYTLFNY